MASVSSTDNYGIPDPFLTYAGCAAYYHDAVGSGEAVLIESTSSYSTYGPSSFTWVEIDGYDALTNSNNPSAAVVKDADGNTLFMVFCVDETPEHHDFARKIRVPTSRTPLTLYPLDNWEANKIYMNLWYTIGTTKSASFEADTPGATEPGGI